MNKRRKFFVLTILCVLSFTFVTTAYARDIGSWTKNLNGYSSWVGTVTQTRYHSTEKAVINFTHPNAYVWWHGTNNAATVEVQAFKVNDFTCYTVNADDPNLNDITVNDNERQYQKWSANFTGETYLTLQNLNSTMIDTKGTWSPDQT